MKLGKSMKIKIAFSLIVSTGILVLAGFFLFRAGQGKKTYTITEPNVLKNTITKDDYLESTKWIWIDPNDKNEVTWTAEQAYQEAKSYVEGNKPEQLQALKMYQRVLDAKPSRLLELHVKLIMGSRMMILFDPGLGESDMYDEAFKWYKKLVYDFNDMGNHTDMMTAKVHLGDLYCWTTHGIAEAQKASVLCMEVINVPEKDIIFDNPQNVALNFDNMSKKVDDFIDKKFPPLLVPAPEADKMRERIRQERLQMAMKSRQGEIDRYRLAAIRSLITKQSGTGPRDTYIERLRALKQKRPDDKLYQETIDAKIQELIENIIYSL